MFELSKTAPNYQNLVANGVTARNLTCISLYEYRWSIEVVAPGSMDKDSFKRHVQYFLEQEFEASEFQWYAPKTPDSLRRAKVSFKSFAL